MKVVDTVKNAHYEQWIKDFIVNLFEKHNIDADKVMIDEIDNKRIYIRVIKDGEKLPHVIRTWKFKKGRVDEYGMYCSEMLEYTLFKSIEPDFDYKAETDVDSIAPSKAKVEWSMIPVNGTMKPAVTGETVAYGELEISWDNGVIIANDAIELREKGVLDDIVVKWAQEMLAAQDIATFGVQIFAMRRTEEKAFDLQLCSNKDVFYIEVHDFSGINQTTTKITYSLFKWVDGERVTLVEDASINVIDK